MSNLIVDKQTHYEFFATADGSPSIRLSSTKYRPEAMHHCDGALSESLFIYYQVLNEALARGCPPRVLSVGLGCGYNELITAAHYLQLVQLRNSDLKATKANAALTELNAFYIESFEGDTNLRETFLQWLGESPHPDDISDPNNTSVGATSIGAATLAPDIKSQLRHTFDQVLILVCAHFKITPHELKIFLSQLKEKNQFVLREWLTENTVFTQTFGVIFFDAFSNQSTPELWTEDFLVQFLARASANKCGFATYAATGALNRALKLSHFIRHSQPGFSGKRESTRAFKS